MHIYIRRNNEDFGPYSREKVLEYVKQGVFKAGDSAVYAGMSEWKTVRELLGTASASRPAGFSKPGGSTPPTASNQTRATAPEGRQPARQEVSGPMVEKKKNAMIVLNLVLILIVVVTGYIRLGGGGKRANGN